MGPRHPHMFSLLIVCQDLLRALLLHSSSLNHELRSLLSSKFHDYSRLSRSALHALQGHVMGSTGNGVVALHAVRLRNFQRLHLRRVRLMDDNMTRTNALTYPDLRWVRVTQVNATYHEKPVLQLQVFQLHDGETCGFVAPQWPNGRSAH
ncbi:uncharacterized protein HD556DRAFT_1335626 [Suillus plorans]|uniref:Secreted protein n=1 Tax=Suillus plorans TaxID=116603 RepID=A0A9P7DSM5_9AGAM|nr:uncharacterized protein HD556DRAFT_1335626 [Suillus plorans]KAG1802163.1 hypothetical protein HD556DRAFT_1335626 [Suillus plorans]